MEDVIRFAGYTTGINGQSGYHHIFINGKCKTVNPIRDKKGYYRRVKGVKVYYTV